jgi:perosamine synthetase
MPKHIPVSEPSIDKKEIAYVNRAVKSGWVSSNGEYIKKFEDGFASFCNRKYAQAVSNGTVALHLALLALDIKKGDEVIVPNITFIATANAVTYTGAKPILVDVEKDTLNIDPNDIERKITKKTKAIIVVHLYGHPCDIDAISAIAKKHHLYIVEDAAEAHGALYKGKKCGSFGDISCFSFYGNKLITTGEGGMCLTDDENLYRKIKSLRGQGMSETKRYWHNIIGYNYRLTNIQAALGCAQLLRIKEFLAAKRKNAVLYEKFLTGETRLILPKEKSYATSSFWMYTVLLSEQFSAGDRDDVIKKLKEKNIEVRNIFYPLSDLPPYKHNGKNLFISKNVAYRGISLPSSTKLSTADISYVCRILLKIVKNQ